MIVINPLIRIATSFVLSVYQVPMRGLWCGGFNPIGMVAAILTHVYWTKTVQPFCTQDTSHKGTDRSSHISPWITSIFSCSILLLIIVSLSPSCIVIAATHRAPKQWCLNRSETVNTCESWCRNLAYTLSLDENCPSDTA